MDENKNNNVFIIIGIIVIILLCLSNCLLIWYLSRKPVNVVVPSPVVQESVGPVIIQKQVDPIIVQEQVDPIAVQEETGPVIIQKQVDPIVVQEQVDPIVVQEMGLKYSTITNGSKGNYCLDIENQSSANNVAAIVHDCIGDTNELFAYLPTSKQLMAKHSQKCLSFNKSNKESNLIQQSCTNNLSQQFDLINNTIKPSSNNKLCLDINKNNPYTKFQNCANTKSQKWFYNFAKSK